jgi:phytoene synthase
MALASEIVALARALEPDRYLAALGAPAPARDDLIALAAFAAEIRRISRLVHDPLVGEIRLTWWREALEALVRGEPADHPIADALAGPIQRGVYPVSRLTGFIDAMVFDLSPMPFADSRAREVYLGKTEGTLFRLSLARLGGAEEQEPLVRTAAIAYGLARAALTLGAGQPLVTEADLAAAGRTIHQLSHNDESEARQLIAGRLSDLTRTAMDEARRTASDIPPQLRVALLPLAMVPAYRRWALRPAGAPSMAPLIRVWRIWRANRTRRPGG